MSALTLFVAPAAPYGVTAAIAEDKAVVSRSGEQRVFAGAGLQEVMAAPSVEAIASRSAAQPIASRPAVQPIVAATHQATPGHARTGAAAVAKQGVSAREPSDHVQPATTAYDIVTRGPGQDVVTGRGQDGADDHATPGPAGTVGGVLGESRPPALTSNWNTRPSTPPVT